MKSDITGTLGIVSSLQCLILMGISKSRFPNPRFGRKLGLHGHDTLVGTREERFESSMG